jgi:holliday junction DNA helicase RuvA
MIGYLEGKVKTKRDGALIVLVGGVGYLVQVPAPTLMSTNIGDEVALHIEPKASENAPLILYGVETERERDLFVALCKVQSVGGKVALLIIGHLGFERFCQAIHDEDLKTIQSVSGVGPAMAKKLIPGCEKFVKANFTPENADVRASNANVERLTLALNNLGFRHDGVRATVEQTVGSYPANAEFRVLLGACLTKVSIAA